MTWARTWSAGHGSKCRGRRDTIVRLRFGEMLNPDGTLYVANLRSAKATDTYILSGRGRNVWEPHFTFHGFRYVEVTGYPGVPGSDAVTGCVLHSDIPRTGAFECGNPLVNQLGAATLTGGSGATSSPFPPTARSAMSGWAGWAMRRFLSARRQATGMWRRSLPMDGRCRGCPVAGRRLPRCRAAPDRHVGRRSRLGRCRGHRSVDDLSRSTATRAFWRPITTRWQSGLSIWTASTRTISGSTAATTTSATGFPLPPTRTKTCWRRPISPMTRRSWPASRPCWASTKTRPSTQALFDDIKAAFNAAYVAEDA